MRWISIHAPRVGSDIFLGVIVLCLFIFQSTLPVWGATISAFQRGTLSIFQSTLPVWGATPAQGDRKAAAGHFNPRSPCGERHLSVLYMVKPDDFNPRSPCGERLNVIVPAVVISTFQSTLPVWGATTINTTEARRSRGISIHAPRVGSDPGPAAV